MSVEEMKKLVRLERPVKLSQQDVVDYCIAVHELGVVKNFSQAAQDLQLSNNGLAMRLRVMWAEGAFEGTGVSIEKIQGTWVIK